ncbi:MAG TPA: nitronate monooxygenase [Gemmatimonadaceae bacterium]|nr:nitronate monooxygenase [Gemmatimonadaceae bacterium]
MSPESAGSAPPHPAVIQGGMGIGVSNWSLARAVSRAGQLGVVSGTAVDTVLVRRLQDGDVGGHVRRAMEHFPIARAATRVLERYYLPRGRKAGAPYAVLPMYRQSVSVDRQQTTMLANFVEVWLAKEGHDGVVGINLLTKVQMPNLASLYGAMLAGVDYVLMGAGIPREIPGVLDALARHEPTWVKMDVEGDTAPIPELLTFDPHHHWAPTTELTRPRFVPIVSANSLAATLARKASGRVDGFVVEGPTAGGHNAPPRGEPRFNADGEPLYGERDLVDVAKMRELGLPFWLAGGKASAGAVHAAREVGAAGVQVGTLFAYCAESGFAPALKRDLLAGIAQGRARVRTDPRASPTGYPFKVVEVEAMPRQDEARERVCDLGYLRTAYRAPTGKLGYRCPAEPVASYVGKGGDAADTVGRRCLCNGLTANIGLPQRRDGGDELPLVTSGDDLASVVALARSGADYTAADVIAHLLANPSPH